MEFNEIFAEKRSKAQAEKAAVLVTKHPLVVEKLIKYLSSDNKENNQKAAYIIHKITDLDTSLLSSYQAQMLPLLNAPVHISVRRCVLRLYCQIEINDDIAGQVVDKCFDLLMDGEQPPAIKVYAMTTVAIVAQKYPDLMHELSVVLEEQMPFGSAGFQNRAKKILAGCYKLD